MINFHDRYCKSAKVCQDVFSEIEVFFLCTFRQQIDKYRREGEDAKNRLYEYEADAQRIQQETALENEKVKQPSFPSTQTSYL